MLMTLKSQTALYEGRVLYLLENRLVTVTRVDEVHPVFER